MTKVRIRPLRAGEGVLAAGLIARAMRDNPTTVAMYGEESLERLVGMQTIWTAFFRRPAGPAIGAFYKGCMVGAASASPPGHCIGKTFRGDAAEVVAAGDPGAGHPNRAAFVQATYAVHDIAEPHWHVGPVGVEPRIQGRGIGEALMRALIDVMDEDGSASWGETDTTANVRFYQALGWTLTHDVEVVGIPLWFLHRPGPNTTPTESLVIASRV